MNQPRHSIEVATINDVVYLPRQTGDRRFWPIGVLQLIDITKLRADRLQLWGEAAHYQSQGRSLTLDEALWDEAAVEQDKRRVKHPWEDILAGMTEVPDKTSPIAGVRYVDNAVVHVVDGEEPVVTAAIFEHVLKIPNGQLNNGHSKTMAEIMRRLGWEDDRVTIEGKQMRGYRRCRTDTDQVKTSDG